MEHLDLDSSALPSEFGASSKKRKRDDDNVLQTINELREGEKIDYVNQLVISNAHSHRSGVSHILSDVFRRVPRPRTVIHNLWPSMRITGQNSKYVKIIPIMPKETKAFADIPMEHRVPTAGSHTIEPYAWEAMEKDWFPLTQGVSLEDFQAYNFYKHLRFNFLEGQNIWDITMVRSLPAVSEDFDMNLMNYLNEIYEFGKEYECEKFRQDVHKFFGVHVNVVFAIAYKGRYWKETRILYDGSVIKRMDFNAHLRHFDMGDTFVFENIYTRTNPFVDKASEHLAYDLVFVDASPSSKSGSLRDYCGCLSIALAKRGHRVMVVSPKYQHGMFPSSSTGVDATVNISGIDHEILFTREYQEGVDWVFVDLPDDQANFEFYDSQFQSTLLCHAACEAPLVLSMRGITFRQDCLFIVNDCHAGLVPMLLAANYRPRGIYQKARTILVIHNLAVQGVELAPNNNLGLNLDYCEELRWQWEQILPDDAINVLTGSILTSDLILTTSEGYSWEILTSEGGCGLHEVLNSRFDAISGITSGIDVNEWNPMADECIQRCYANYDLSGKAECKEALQVELNLPVRANHPLIGFIGSLDTDKGADIILSAVPELVASDIQLVMLVSPLGSGEEVFDDDWMTYTEKSYPDFFRGRDGFNSSIFHRVMAGCDILLMPSRVEPSGSLSLCAMRYGTVPVVHAIGGLKDTVQDFDVDAGREEGTGWTFSPLTVQKMIEALGAAVKTYRRDQCSWNSLMKRGMELNSSWDIAAEQYENLIKSSFI